MESVLFDRSLCPLILSRLSTDDQANSRLVCVFWKLIIEKFFGETPRTFHRMLNSGSQRFYHQPLKDVSLRWTSKLYNGKIPIVEDLKITIHEEGHQGYATSKFNIKTRKFQPSLHWFYNNGRRDFLRPKRSNKMQIYLRRNHRSFILQLDDPDLIHRSLHFLGKKDKRFYLDRIYFQ